MKICFLIASGRYSLQARRNEIGVLRWCVCVSQVAGFDLGGGPGEVGLQQAAAEPPAEGFVSQETVPAAEHPARSAARHQRVSGSVQTGALELLDQRREPSVRIRAEQRWGDLHLHLHIHLLLFSLRSPLFSPSPFLLFIYILNSFFLVRFLSLLFCFLHIFIFLLFTQTDSVTSCWFNISALTQNN